LTIFSERLRWLREKKMLSQKEVAESLNVSQQYYNKFEKGTGEPNLEVLYKIRTLFDEDLDFLLGVRDIDHESMQLQYFYFWLRQERDHVQKRIQIGTDTLKQVQEINSELRITRLIELKEELLVLEENVRKAFIKLVSQLQKIPSINEKLLLEEGWDSRYQQYVDDQSQIKGQFIYLFPKYESPKNKDPQ
jgi:transcriptional regulator with XRE-family HTH domain